MKLAAKSKAKPRERDPEEERFLDKYTPADFPRPSITVDLVILTVQDRDLRVLLVQRGDHPFKDRWALPGGFVRVSDDRKNQGEDLDAAALRELEEETGLSAERGGRIFLEQVRTFGKPGRDPRMRVISVAYYALVRPTLVPLIRAGGDAASTRWFSVAELPNEESLAFDHAEILAAALARARADLDRSTIAFELVPETFTIQELRAVHETVGGATLDPGNFRKKFLRMIEDGLIETARGKRATASKPASIYRFVRSAGV
ncbi:MAG: ADP-ribose pyrophosphatase [Labilithrix sp.]|nr:ADP-ribose pyrophosphatase [Labilithrix sp.]